MKFFDEKIVSENKFVRNTVKFINVFKYYSVSYENRCRDKKVWELRKKKRKKFKSLVSMFWNKLF